METTIPKLILLVDDDPYDLDITALFLKAKGYEILRTTDPERAYDLAETRLPDLIISDIAMPGIDGITLCKGLKDNRITREIPVVFVTGTDKLSDVEAGFSSGARLYLPKPVDWDQCWSRVEALIMKPAA